MARRRDARRGARIHLAIVATTAIVVPAIAGSCRTREAANGGTSYALLRVGIGQMSADNPIIGIRQLAQILTIESPARVGEDGRMQPWLADGWTLGADGRSVTVKLRPNLKFHDGSPLDAPLAANVLLTSLRSSMGPIFSDIEHVRATGPDLVELGFRRASPFFLESLEATIQKPGATSLGTGAFRVAPDSKTDLTANKDYYLGAPAIDVVRVESYPSVRTAWAELLRDRIDMLWEVGADALDSMTNSSTVSVFTFTKRYQHVIALNRKSSVMSSPEIRRALSKAIDRAALVKNALNDYGVPSSGPIWPNYWALPADLPKFEFEPQVAAEAVSRAGHGGTRRAGSLRFTCLVPPDSVNERLALEVKRQLAAVDVEMAVEEVPVDQIVKRTTGHEYDAALIEFISGPTLIRPYLIWHSNTPLNWAGFGNPKIDVALDGIRDAASEDQYRQRVAAVQRAFMDDPPAIFLAWAMRARAISKRFAVQAEPGRDPISTMRMWKPVSDERQASRN